MSTITRPLPTAAHDPTQDTAHHPLLSPARWLHDDLFWAGALLVLLAIAGAVGVGVFAGWMTPAGVPVGGVAHAARLAPAFARVPAQVETGGQPLTVTLQPAIVPAASGRYATRYVVIARAPHDAPATLCDAPTATQCPLPLDGTPRQRGMWLLTLRVYDDAGGYAETQAWMRVA